MFVNQFLLTFSFLFYFAKRLKREIKKFLWRTFEKKAVRNDDLNPSPMNNLEDLEKNCFVDSKKTLIPIDIFFTTIPIEMEFHKKISGLTTLKCSRLQFLTRNGILYGEAAFNTNKLIIHFESSFKVFNIGPKIVFDTIFENVKLIIELKLIPVIGKSLYIDNLLIEELNVKKSRISGMGLFNAIVNFIFSKIIDPIYCLKFFIEFQIKRLINLHFSEIIPCVQILQYSTTIFKKYKKPLLTSDKITEINKCKHLAKLRVNFLGLEREIRRKESFCSIICHTLTKELLVKIGLHSNFGEKYKKGMAIEYLNFARNFITDLDVGLIPSEEFECLDSFCESLSSNSESSESVSESSFSPNESKTESENLSHDASDFGFGGSNSEDDTKNAINHQSENIYHISLNNPEDVIEVTSKSDKNDCVNEVVSRSDEKDYIKEAVSRYEEKYCVIETASKSDEKDCVNAMASDGLKEIDISVSLASDSTDAILSDTKCSDLDTTQLEQSCKDSEICDINISNSDGSPSIDSILESEGSIKSIEYICYLDCFLDSLEYESDLKCATSNNQLHLRYSENN